MVITLASTEKEKEKTYINYSFSGKINDLQRVFLNQQINQAYISQIFVFLLTMVI